MGCVVAFQRVARGCGKIHSAGALSAAFRNAALEGSDIKVSGVANKSARKGPRIRPACVVSDTAEIMRGGVVAGNVICAKTVKAKR